MLQTTINAPPQTPTHDVPTFVAVAIVVAVVCAGLLAVIAYWMESKLGVIQGNPLRAAVAYYLQYGMEAWTNKAGLSDPAALRAWWNLHPVALWTGHLVTAFSALVGLIAGYHASKPPGDAFKGETHIEGPRYIQDPRAAAKQAQGREIDLIKRVGKGVRIGGKQDRHGAWRGGVQISRDRETKHIYVIGKTGGGKTVAIKPIIMQAIDRGDQVVIFDNKGEFTEWLYQIDGKEPVLLAPWDQRSAAWDIGRDCRTSAQAVELAARLIPEGASDPMWNQGARQILAGLIKKLQAERRESWTWSDLAALLSVSLSDVEEIMKKYHPEGLRAVEKMDAGGKEGGKSTSKTTQSLMITLSSQMSPVYRMGEAWEKANVRFSIRDFIDKKSAQVLILQGSADYSEIATAYLQGVIATIRARINSPDFVERKPSDPGIWMILDEFPQMGKLEKVAQFLEIGRSKGVRVVFGIQDNSQMFSIYGNEDGRVLMAQPQSFILAGVGDVDSIKWMQAKIGQRIVERHRRSASLQIGQGSSISAQMQRDTEHAIREDQFNDGLGNTGSGVRVLYYPGQGDVYRLLLPFPNVDKVRPASVPAPWTLPTWEQPPEGRGEVERERPIAPQEPQDASVPVASLPPKPARLRVRRAAWLRLIVPTGAPEHLDLGGEVMEHIAEDMMIEVAEQAAPALGPLLHAIDVLENLLDAGKVARRTATGPVRLEERVEAEA